MKGVKIYLFVSRLCLALAIAVMLLVATYVVSAAVSVWQPGQAIAQTPYSGPDGGVGRDTDPLIGFNFRLEFEGKSAGYFTECSGIGSETEIVEHRVVDESGNEVVQKIPGRLRWSNVILKRGITDNMDLWEWRQQVETGMMSEARVNCSIIMMDRNYEDVARWDFVNAWPCRITGPGISGDSNEFGVEEIEIVCEGMERVTKPLQGALFGIFWE